MTDKSKRPMFVEKSFTVKTYDIDFAGHVSNIVYIRWLEDLRFQMLEEHLPLKPQMEQGYAPILARTNIQYKRAIRLFEPVIGQLWVQNVGAARIILASHIMVNNEICADVVQEGVFADLATGRPMRVPAEMRHLVEHWGE